MELESFEEPTTNIPVSMVKLLTSFEPEQLQFDTAGDVNLLVTLQGAPHNSLQRKSRAPVDLVAVIDRSSSMKEKLPLVRQTLLFMIKQLKAGDHLGVVVYDQMVDVLIPLLNMDAEGKARATTELNLIALGGQTNISGGLLKGLDMIRRRPSQTANDVATVLLFTDGLANLGLTKTPQIRQAVRGVLGQIDAVCSVFTFGYGSGPDPSYLREIAEQANGMYYFIQNADAIPLAFTDCLGGLLSVVGQNLVLTIEVEKGVRLVEIKTNFKKQVSEKFATITIEDLYSEEEKDILCVVHLDKLEMPQEKNFFLNVSVRYNNLIEHKSEYLFEQCEIARPVTVTMKEVNLKIDKQKNRLICADAMQEAIKAGENADYQRAATVLNNAAATITLSHTAQDSYCVSLVQQLREGQQQVSDREQFRREGQNHLTSVTTSHYQQRSNRNTYGTYTTTCKASVTSEYTSHS